MGRAKANSHPMHGFGSVLGFVPIDGAIDAKRAMEHPILFPILNKIATAVGEVVWYAEAVSTGAKSSARSKEVEQVQAVLDRPKLGWTGNKLRHWIALNMAAFGIAALKAGPSSSGNSVGSVDPLDISQLRFSVDMRGDIASYTYGMSPGDVTYKPKLLPRDNDFAFQISPPELNGAFVDAVGNARKSSPLASVQKPSNIILNLLERATKEASGNAGISHILKFAPTLALNAQQEIIDKIKEKGEEITAKKFLCIKGVEGVIPIDDGLSDIHSKVPFDDMTKMLARAFGVPIALIGANGADSSKYASNYAESRLAFYQDTIIPSYLTPIAESMTEAICPPGVVVKFDKDTIEALISARIARAKDLQTITYLTDDEKRELAGFAPLQAKKP